LKYDRIFEVKLTSKYRITYLKYQFKETVI